MCRAGWRSAPRRPASSCWRNSFPLAPWPFAQGSRSRCCPRVTCAGIEARPSAFSAMAAVWVSLLLVVAVRREKPLLWLAYGAALLVAIVLDVYLVLMVLVHAVFVAVVQRNRSAIPRFALAAGGTLVLSSPFLFLAQSQQGQLNWIPPLSAHTLIDVGVLQYFDHSVPFILLAGLVVAATVLLYGNRLGRLSESDRQLLWLVIAWVLIPTSILLVYSAISGPAYYVRYLSHRTGSCASPGGLRRGAGPHADPHYGTSRSTSTCRAAELPGAARPVCQVRNGLQPGRGPHHAKGTSR